MHNDIAQLVTPFIDEKYASFARKLLPKGTVLLGVRLPILKKTAKQIVRSGRGAFFLSHLTQETFEEKMLFGFITAFMNPFRQENRDNLVMFLKQIDNWSLCDSFCVALSMTRDDKVLFLPFLRELLTDSREYYVRFAVVMLLTHYTEECYLTDCLHLLSMVSHSGYYAQMAVAWAVSIFYIHYPKETEVFLKHNHLSAWTQNKAIQKIGESKRISAETKQRIRQYRKAKTEQGGSCA